MAHDSNEIARHLKVGAPAVFIPDVRLPAAGHFRTAFRGWKLGKLIALDRPAGPDGVFTSLRAGQVCGIRFIANGLACSFDAEIIEWDRNAQYPSMRLTWPRAMGCTAFRKFERVAVAVPCAAVAEDGKEESGTLCDLSLGGCAIELPIEIPEGRTLLLSFDLPDGARIRQLRAAVRSVRAKGDRTHVAGLQFEPGQVYAESDVAFFLRSKLQRTEAGPTQIERSPILLVVDPGAESCARIKQVAETCGFDVQLAGSAFDGICKVRATAPALLVLREALPDLSGAELGRLLRNNDVGKSIPLVFIADGAPAKLLEALGDTCVLPDGAGMLETLEKALRKYSAPKQP